MKIEVARSENEPGHLVFTIAAKDSIVNGFTMENQMVLDQVNLSVRNLEKSLNQKFELHEETMLSMHSAKWKLFVRMLNKLKSSINNDLRSQFEPMCNEIFNWIYDNQKEPVVALLSQYSLQRTKYYF